MARFSGWNALGFGLVDALTVWLRLNGLRLRLTIPPCWNVDGLGFWDVPDVGCWLGKDGFLLLEL
jgi:hypothetical protein